MIGSSSQVDMYIGKNLPLQTLSTSTKKELKTFTMNKIIILLSLLTISLFVKGQNLAQFNSESFTSDLLKFNSLAKKNMGSKKWSTELIKLFPLDENNCIHYKYDIFYADSEISKKFVFDKSLIWVNQNFDVTHGATITADTTNYSIIAIGQWGSVGQHYGLGATIIHVPMKMRIRIQQNKLTVEIKVQNYRMGSMNLYGKGIESALVAVSSVYPLNQKSDHKDSYAMAFINSNSNSLNTISNFLSFLNKSDVNINDNW